MREMNFNIIQRQVRSRAFTLMEAAIALAITSVSLLALLKLQIASAVLADTAELTTQAVLLADGKIAEALAEDYPNLGVARGTVEQGGISLEWQREITEVYLPQFGNLNSDLSGKGLRKISVEVSWKKGLANKHLNLSSYVAEKTLK